MKNLYYNGDFVPMTSKDAAIEALVVDDEGKIAFVGELEKAREAAGGAPEIDLEGATVMPGFVDPHSHFMMADQLVTQADLSQCESFADIQRVLRDFIEANGLGSGDVVLARGYDQNELVERTHPDKFVLDEVSTDMPIFAAQVSGHMGVANSRAMELVGLTAQTPDPEGGCYGRVGDTMEPNGYCEEISAVLPMTEKLMALTATDKTELVRKTQDIYASNGITTCQDGASVGSVVGGFLAVVEAGGLAIDVVGYPVVSIDKESVCAQYGSYFSSEYSNHFRFGGLKMILDGSPQGRTAWMSEPYEPGDDGATDWCAYPSLTDEAVTAYASEAIDGGYQLLTHCNGDAASEQLLRCYKKAYEASENPEKDKLRPVMIHCQTARRDQYERMEELNMIPSIFTSHIWYWGDTHLKNFGKERGGRISAVHDALECGLMYNFHTDAPIVLPDMLLTVWCAVNRITKRGAQLDESQKIGVFDALKAITINAAYEYGEEDRKGTLEKGKLADLVVLDKNPLKVDPMDIRDIAVLKTIKEGEVIWER